MLNDIQKKKTTIVDPKDPTGNKSPLGLNEYMTEIYQKGKKYWRIQTKICKEDINTIKLSVKIFAKK